MGENEQEHSSAGTGDLWYVPCSPVESGAEQVQLEMREREDGSTALLAYTSLERLVAGCGKEQPWVAVHSGEIEDIQQQANFDLVAFDVELPTDMRPYEHDDDLDAEPAHGEGDPQ